MRARLTVPLKRSHGCVMDANHMPVQTKFLWLSTPAALDDRIAGWRVCWLGGWDKYRVFFRRDGGERARWQAPLEPCLAVAASYGRCGCAILWGLSSGIPGLVDFVTSTSSRCPRICLPSKTPHGAAPFYPAAAFAPARIAIFPLALPRSIVPMPTALCSVAIPSPLRFPTEFTCFRCRPERWMS